MTTPWFSSLATETPPMSEPAIRVRLSWADHYMDDLYGYLEHGDDTALERAYELGRLALKQRVSLLDLYEIHQGCCDELARNPDIAANHKEIRKSASHFLLNALGAFEMAHSGYRELIGHLEEKLKIRAAELECSNRELEAFCYSVSHDLQEPLRMITSFAELFAKRHNKDLDETSEKYLLYVVDGAHRMKEMLTGVLAYSRLGTGSTDNTEIDCNRLVGNVLDVLQISIKDVGARVKVDHLPAIKGDQLQLSQVFLNLIGNALKFSRNASPLVEITAMRDGDEWVFSVIDNGIGIDPQFKERIFELFQRLHAREDFEGTGIGLALVRRIIERHGGRIWVESEPGLGSTFRFALPAGEEGSFNNQQ